MSMLTFGLRVHFSLDKQNCFVIVNKSKHKDSWSYILFFGFWGGSSMLKQFQVLVWHEKFSQGL